MERKFSFAVDSYYHLYNRGTDKRKIFLNRKDYQRFMILLHLCNNKEGVHLNNYRGLTSVELLKLLTAYSMYFNKKYQRDGSLFQGTFQAVLVEKDTQLRYLYSYIHLNPVKLVDPGWREHPNEAIKNINYLNSYDYSSFYEHCLGKKRVESIILSPNDFPEYFSTVQESLTEVASWLYTED